MPRLIHMHTHEPARKKPTNMDSAESVEISRRASCMAGLSAFCGRWDAAADNHVPASPTPIGTSRERAGGRRRARWRTPSGVIWTGCSARSVVTTASSGTPSRTTSSAPSGTVTSSTKMGMPWPSVTMLAATGLSTRKASQPSRVPAIAATAVSVAASTALWNRVAPARRTAANRSSRRAPPTRVVKATNTATGPTTSAATIPKKIPNRSARG